MTLLFLKISAKYCAPLRPILFSARSNVVNVCNTIEKQCARELVTLLYYFSMHQRDILLRYFRFGCS